MWAAIKISSFVLLPLFLLGKVSAESESYFLYFYTLLARDFLLNNPPIPQLCLWQFKSSK